MKKKAGSCDPAFLILRRSRARCDRHAVLPQIVPGMAAGIVLVFAPATGQFVIPDLLGGSRTVLLGNVIQQQFGSSRDWPFGSALAAIAMFVVLIALWFHARLAQQKGAPQPDA